MARYAELVDVSGAWRVTRVLTASIAPPADGTVVRYQPVTGDDPALWARWDGTAFVGDGYVPPLATATFKVSRQAFMDRIGDDAVAAILTLARTNAQVEAWVLRYQIVSDVDLRDPRTIGGIDALIAAGLIPSNRRAGILTP
jgi:hypothetical protein